MQGPLDPGSGAFGGDHWAEEYAAIRTANDLLAVIGTATALTAEEQSADDRASRRRSRPTTSSSSSTPTPQDSIPIDVGTDVTAPPAPFVSNADAYARVDRAARRRSDRARRRRGARSRSRCPPGFAGFNTPATFRQFNRALRARVAVYRGDFAGALTVLAESFIDPAGPLDRRRVHGLQRRAWRLRQSAGDRPAERARTSGTRRFAPGRSCSPAASRTSAS